MREDDFSELVASIKEAGDIHVGIGSLHVFSRSGRSISRRFARGYSGRNPSSPS